MSRLKAVKDFLLKVENSDGEGTAADDVRTLLQQTIDNYHEIVQCNDELKRNKMSIEELCVGESNLNLQLRNNAEEACNLKSRIDYLECELNIQKVGIETQKHVHDIVAQEMKHTIAIDTGLGKTLMDRFGIRLELKPVDLHKWQVKCVFQDQHFVLLLYNTIDSTFDLQSIEPPHPSFNSIRQFLEDSGDISGFLCAVRQHHFLKK